MAEEKRNLCAQIPISLHSRVRQEQEASGQTLSEYMTQLITEFYQMKEGYQNMNLNMKTIAFQVPVELFEELYCEPFYVPQPDELVFGSWYEDGFIFRSGLCYYRGAGKIFYFQPGHEFCRSFYNPYVQRILKNAVRWAAPNEIVYPIENGCPCLQYKLSDKF